jgi:hypothetical protein
MNKEIINEGVMREFIDGFVDERWKDNSGIELVLHSEDGKSLITYEDLGVEPGSVTELILWVDNGAWGDQYVLNQVVEDGKIENRFIVPPYDDLYRGDNDWAGICYGPDGKMQTIRRIKGLPRKIDMDKTIELFLKQVAEKRFTTPVLVKAK